MAYTELLELQKRADLVDQISQDVTRTFPGLADQFFIDKLSRVLIAYSIRNSKLGYWQAMNFIAGTLLIFMDEENACWMLGYIVENLLCNYYTPSTHGFNLDTDVFELLVAEQLPELYKHLQDTEVSFRILTSPWFFCLFANDFPTETSFLVWDSIMMEGKVVLYEVGLAILRMLKSELMICSDQGELINHIRQRTLSLHNPAKLLKHWRKLDKANVLRETQRARKRIEEVEKVMITLQQFGELDLCTHFEPKDYLYLWRQYISLDPSIHKTGLTLFHFAQLVGGTFSEWQLDRGLVEHLFNIVDEKHDNILDFAELAKFLSVICRGTRKEITSFTFRLFDLQGKGWLDKEDIYHMLQSIYSVYSSDKKFHDMLRFFVDTIFDCKGTNAISKPDFEYVVSIQPQILERFKARNPRLKVNPKHTYFYWMFMNRPSRDKDILPLSLDLQAWEKQSKVLLPPIVILKRAH
jgi:hypothetical protein